jgi:hypothetical protein
MDITNDNISDITYYELTKFSTSPFIGIDTTDRNGFYLQIYNEDKFFIYKHKRAACLRYIDLFNKKSITYNRNHSNEWISLCEKISQSLFSNNLNLNKIIFELIIAKKTINYIVNILYNIAFQCFINNVKLKVNLNYKDRIIYIKKNYAKKLHYINCIVRQHMPVELSYIVLQYHQVVHTYYFNNLIL